jgi:hypothetical protein
MSAISLGRRSRSECNSAALAVSFPVAIVTRSPGCEFGALPWLLAGRQDGAAPRRGCAVGLDRLGAWEAARKR